MYRLIAAALALGALTSLGPAAARANSYMAVENARANARAGGPTNRYDAQLLERYGCLSGTNSEFCRQLEHRGGGGHRADRRRTYRHQ